jgi:hypothetical protein
MSDHGLKKRKKRVKPAVRSEVRKAKIGLIVVAVIIVIFFGAALILQKYWSGELPAH